MQNGMLARLLRARSEQRISRDLNPFVNLMSAVKERDLSAYTDRDLKEISVQLKNRAAADDELDTLLVDAYALVCEVAARVIGMRPFDVQVMAAIALHGRTIVEMQTGEGKTLTAVMPAYLHALTGRGVHVLTFNDYLAKRDASWMGPIYEFLGLTASYISDGMNRVQRRQAYCADVTYLTAKEAGFDYLRGSLCMNADLLVQRPFYYAIVDEADSILIDEARIPLVIAGELHGTDHDPLDLADVVKRLQPGADYEIEQYGHNLFLTDEGLAKAERLLGRENLYAPENLDLLTKLNCALYAQALLARDRDYIVRHGKIELIDEFTGRVADKRHWPDGIQAAVEAKEGLIPGTKGMIMGSIAVQHFLRIYPLLSGMTGTARPAASEFRDCYGLDVISIPTHSPCIRKDHPSQIFTHRQAKRAALLTEIARAHTNGQPVLVGTSSVAESEELAADLKRAGISCSVLNAKNDEMDVNVNRKVAHRDHQNVDHLIRRPNQQWLDAGFP